MYIHIYVYMYSYLCHSVAYCLLNSLVVFTTQTLQLNSCVLSTAYIYISLFIVL